MRDSDALARLYHQFGFSWFTLPEACQYVSPFRLRRLYELGTLKRRYVGFEKYYRIRRR